MMYWGVSPSDCTEARRRQCRVFSEGLECFSGFSDFFFFQSSEGLCSFMHMKLKSRVWNLGGEVDLFKQVLGKSRKWALPMIPQLWVLHVHFLTDSYQSGGTLLDLVESLYIPRYTPALHSPFCHKNKKPLSLNTRWLYSGTGGISNIYIGKEQSILARFYCRTKMNGTPRNGEEPE